MFKKFIIALSIKALVFSAGVGILLFGSIGASRLIDNATQHKITLGALKFMGAYIGACLMIAIITMIAFTIFAYAVEPIYKKPTNIEG